MIGDHRDHGVGAVQGRDARLVCVRRPGAGVAPDAPRRRDRGHARALGRLVGPRRGARAAARRGQGSGARAARAPGGSRGASRRRASRGGGDHRTPSRRLKRQCRAGTPARSRRWRPRSSSGPGLVAVLVGDGRPVPVVIARSADVAFDASAWMRARDGGAGRPRRRTPRAGAGRPRCCGPACAGIRASHARRVTGQKLRVTRHKKS